MADLALTAPRDRARGFYAWMSLVCLGIAVVGFVPTFFAPLGQGAFVRPPVFHLHGMLFFAWTVYFCVQSWLAASGRTLAHREWGLLGAGLATAMLFSVMIVLVVRLNQRPPIPAGPGSASFAWVNVGVMLFFETCIVTALANTRRPEIHKRLMLMATISLLGAPIARWFVTLAPPQPGVPPSILVSQGPAWLAALLIVAGMVFDMRTRGRISRIYLVGLPVWLALNLSFGPVGFSPAWLTVADWIKHLPG